MKLHFIVVLQYDCLGLVVNIDDAADRTIFGSHFHDVKGYGHFKVIFLLPFVHDYITIK